MAIPEDILLANAAGRIPDDVSLEYLAETRDGPAKVAIVFLVCLAGVLMLVRLYARTWLVKKIGMDDILAVLTMVCNSPIKLDQIDSNLFYPPKCKR